MGLIMCLPLKFLSLGDNIYKYEYIIILYIYIYIYAI